MTVRKRNNTECDKVNDFEKRTSVCSISVQDELAQLKSAIQLLKQDIKEVNTENNVIKTAMRAITEEKESLNNRLSDAIHEEQRLRTISNEKITKLMNENESLKKV